MLQDKNKRHVNMTHLLLRWRWLCDRSGRLCLLLFVAWKFRGARRLFMRYLHWSLMGRWWHLLLFHRLLHLSWLIRLWACMLCRVRLLLAGEARLLLILCRLSSGAGFAKMGLLRLLCLLTHGLQLHEEPLDALSLRRAPSREVSVRRKRKLQSTASDRHTCACAATNLLVHLHTLDLHLVKLVFQVLHL